MMNSQITNRTLVLLLLTAFCLPPTAVSAQEPAPDKTKEQAGMPALPEKDLLNIRNLQFDQAKRLLEMQNLKARYEQLQSESQSFQSALATTIEAAAKAANVDLTKWNFDANSLKFEKKTDDRRPATVNKEEKER